VRAVSVKASRRIWAPVGASAAWAAFGLVVVIGVAWAAMSLRGRSAHSLARQIGGKSPWSTMRAKPLTEANLNGKSHLVLFGYADCPEQAPRVVARAVLVS
jgi:cytochrome oxidase Cu insertion factor (SCO1/SenC/PrrC family)